MDVTIQIPDGNVDRVATAFASPGEAVTADNLAAVLTEKFSEDIRRTVQGYEAGVAATAAARAVADAQDPLSTKKSDTFAAAQEAVAEARAERLEAAQPAEEVEA